MLGFHTGKRLTQEEARQLAERLASLTDNSLPLASCLREMAGEAPNRRLHTTLNDLAENLARGKTHPEQLATSLRHLPRGLHGMLLATLEQGNAGIMLGRYLEQRTAYRELARMLWLSLAYPVFLVLVTILLALLISVFIVNQFADLYDDFGLMLPVATQLVVWWSRHIAPTALQGLPILIMGVFALRLVLPAARWTRLVNSIPFFGTLRKWLGISQWLRLLSLLIENEVPLPDALGFASRGVNDASISRSSRGFGEGVRLGRSLSQLVAADPYFPSTLIPLLRWGEQTNDLPDALNTTSDYFEQRFRARHALMRSLLPPVIFIAIAMVAIGFVVVTLIMPFMEFFDALS